MAKKGNNTLITGLVGGTGTPTSATPYMEANNAVQSQINNSYDAQVQAANQRKNQALETIQANNQKWLQGQSEIRDAYLQNMKQKEANAKKESNAQYDANAKQNYINYMQAQKQLPSQLNNLGIRGGAAESSLIRMGTNYGTNVANNEMARAQALDSIAQQYADAINEYEAQYKQALLSHDDTTANQIASYLDSWNKELSSIEAGRNEALTNAYATASQNDIEYGINQQAIAREEARNKIADDRYAQEYADAQQSKMLEQYAAGLAKYMNVATLEQMAANIKKQKGWKNDPFKYGKVQAINARIGEIRQNGK